MARKLDITEMERLDVESFKMVEKISLTLVLDNVRSMNNVGSLFRTSDAFRIEKIVLCGITATPPHPMIHKTALGAEYSVDWEYHPSTVSVIKELKARDYKIWALELATDSFSPDESRMEKGDRIALVVGNEVHGVDDEVISIADRCIEIPQLGTKHSLNVSVSTGIALYTIVASQLKILQTREKEGV